jgi:hypothetical protein
MVRGMSHVGEEAGVISVPALAVADLPATPHDDDIIGKAQDFIEIRRGKDHDDAFGRRLADDRMDIGPTADIDTAGWLIKKENAHIHALEAASEEYLLLISATQTGDRLAQPVGIDADGLGNISCRGEETLGCEKPLCRQGVKPRRQKILGDAAA